jgi:hypothetical protein
MRTRTILFAAVALIAVVAIGRVLHAQSKLPIRQIGKLERVSSDSTIASISTALALPNGRVLINDRVGHRVLLLDSTLANEKIVADTSATTAAAYGRRPAGLVHFRGDSTLLIEQSSLSMYVIAPTGAVARVMAMPRADDAASISGNGAIDARGNLIYFDATSGAQGVLMLGVGDLVCKNAPPPSAPPAPARDGRSRVVAGIANTCLDRHVDSMPLLHVDLATRSADTIARLAVPKLIRELKSDENGALTAIESTYDPLPVVDAWTVTSDGTVAVLRTGDYHVDWLDATGKWSSSAKMPFDWQKVDDARKTTLIDSTVARWQGQNDRIMSGGGRGATGLAPLVAKRADPATLPDYVPPINDRPGALVGDADGNLWIRTTTMVESRPVYDIVNRRGALIDRVQLPAFRSIAGFGPGVIYMAMQDEAKRVHLERAKIK